MTPTDTLASTTADAEQLTCEACPRVSDSDDFRAFTFGEVEDPICDECLDVQREAADADRCNADAYYYR